MHSLIQEFWAIVEPHIEEAAIKANIPIELYYYSELGLDTFSKEEFQKRDPYSNPQVFEKVFVTLNFKGWIEPTAEDRYEVSERAREAARMIIQAGDRQLFPFETSTDINLHRLVLLLNQIVMANEFAPSPAEKWATAKRFRVTDKNSPLIVQIRELLMDLYAYRDDCHYAASHPYFGRGGIIWSVLGSLWKNETVDAEKIAGSMIFRGYDVNQYEIALQAAAQLGWAEPTRIPGTFRITQAGRELREKAEQLTNAYFYTPWSILTREELTELDDLLLELKRQLISFRKAK